MAGSRDCELDLERAKKGDLPAVCIRCAAPADFFDRNRLNYHRQRIVLRLPLCSRHEDHWCWQGRASMGILIGAAMLATSIVAAVLIVSFELFRLGRFLLPLAMSVEVAGLATFFGSLILYAVLSYYGIRIRRLGPMSVVLKGVSPEFVEAYRAHRTGQTDSGPLLAGLPEEVNTAILSLDVQVSDEAIAVIQTAGRDAGLWGDGYIGTRHLLAGLRIRATEAAHALQILGINFEQICDSHQTAAPLGSGRSSEGGLPYTPALRRALACAADEAKAHRHSSIRAPHLLLGILREPDNEAVQLLLTLGISPEEAARRSADAIRFLESVMVIREVLPSDAIAAKGPSRGDA